MLRVSTAVLAVTLAVCVATATAQSAVTTTAAVAKNTTAPGTTRMATMAPKTTIPAASQPPATFGKSVLMATVMLTGNFTPFVTNGKFGELKSAVSMGLTQLMRVNSQYFFVRRQWLSNSSMMTEFAVSDKAGVAPAELVRRVMTATTNMTWATAAQGVFRKYTGKNFVVQRPQVITMAPMAMNTTRPAATTTPGASSIPATFGAEALVVTLVLNGDFSNFTTPGQFNTLKMTMEAAIAVLMKLEARFVFIKRMWIASLHTEFAVSAKAGVSVTELTSRAQTATTNTTWASGLRQLGATFTIEAPIVRTPAPVNATTTAAPAISGTPAVVSAAAAVLAAAAAALAL